jgi:hypothetical protein
MNAPSCFICGKEETPPMRSYAVPTAGKGFPSSVVLCEEHARMAERGMLVLPAPKKRGDAR